MSLRTNLVCLTIGWLLIVLLVLAPSIHASLNLSAGSPKLAKIEFQRTDKDYRSDIVTALQFEKSFYTPLSFTKFDRQQNTRLWPFIFTGITRSPPSF
jgi:hypothetical protein